MAQLCTKCSRANPVDAVYCYFDGFVLSGHERRGGPVAVGAQPFNSPFVFPTGRSCRSFDELALACQEEWNTAAGLLRDGYLESFLGGMGRIDLALAAKEASRFPDHDRGLDQLLAKLPSGVLAEPRLRADPVEVNLGRLEGDKERVLELELENQGMRLLYGTVTSSDPLWLTLGDAPGSTEKHFHFTHESRIPIRIHPERVRAGNKPIEGKLIIESNGGTVTVVLRGEKAVIPFPSGPLAGAKTPRKIAELAQAKPKEIAPLFESGEVEKWYAGNGWVYPVKVPAASGLAAIQQFFEALGFTKPPKVGIDQEALHFQAEVGQSLSAKLEVSTPEKKPVWAHAISHVPWMEVSRPKFNGRTATIQITIPSVPNKPGTLLSTELEVLANGNTRFRVPVSIEIPGNAFDFGNPLDFESTPAPEFAPPPPPPLPPPPVPVSNLPSLPPIASSPDGLEEIPELVPVLSIEEELQAPAPSPAPPPSRKIEKPRPARRRRDGRIPVWMHAVPAVLLLLAVSGVVLYDRFGPRMSQAIQGPLPSIAGPQYDPRQLVDDRERVSVQFTSETQRFGVVKQETGDAGGKGERKRLTFREDGGTNNTIVKIDESEYLFGFRTSSNRWFRQQLALPKPYKGWISVMDFSNEQIRVMQYVQLVPGVDNVLDTVLIYYKAENYGTAPHKVGIRLMLDTYIGNNDGVPFTAPGEKGFVTEKAEYTGSKVPDYVEVVENPESASDPGTIARIGLKGLKWGNFDLLEPETVRITRYPGNKDQRWNVPLAPIGKGKDGDSCVVVYWPQMNLGSKDTIHMAMTYGLGKLDISEQLALSVSGSARPGKEFIVTAYVYDAKAGQKVRVELPEGVELTEGKAEQTIEEDSKRTQVFWKVKATQEGTYRIEATSGRTRAKPVTVVVQNRSIFG